MLVYGRAVRMRLARNNREHMNIPSCRATATRLTHGKHWIQLLQPVELANWLRAVSSSLTREETMAVAKRRYPVTPSGVIDLESTQPAAHGDSLIRKLP